MNHTAVFLLAALLPPAPKQPTGKQPPSFATDVQEITQNIRRTARATSGEEELIERIGDHTLDLAHNGLCRLFDLIYVLWPNLKSKIRPLWFRLPAFTLNIFSPSLLAQFKLITPIPKNLYPELHNALAMMSKQAGIQQPRLMMHKTSDTSCALGYLPYNRTIVISERVLKSLPLPELIAIMGHEFGHLKQYHMLVQDLAWLTKGILVSIVQSALSKKDAPQHLDNHNTQHSWVPCLRPSNIINLLLSRLLLNSISQYYEYEADRIGAQLTGASKLATALEHLEEQLDPFYRLSNPTELTKTWHYLEQSILMSSHPPIAERIKRLRASQKPH